MPSAYFTSYDRTLRRMHILNLVEHLESQRSDNFRASLVVNARTGQPLPLALDTRRARAEPSRI